MASPQKENGYTPIANEILDHIVKLPLNGAQWRIIIVVWRFTYGFSRKEHTISESFIVKATGLSKRFVSSELKKLIEWNLIRIIKDSTYTTPKTLSFNKDFDAWKLNDITQQVNNTSTVEEECTSTVEQHFTSTVEESFHQENNYKSNIKTNEHESFFESLWQLYPKKKGKGQVSTTHKKKLFKIGIEEMTRAIERCKRDNVDTDIQYWQNGSTFFNSGYIDYLDKNYTEPEQRKTRGW